MLAPALFWVTCIAAPLLVQASAGGHWCYASQDPACGPNHWKDFSSKCGGENQSPVDINSRNVIRNSNLGDIVFQGYDKAPPGKWRITNNGHTVMVSLEGEVVMGHINISGAGLPNVFRALQIHFHWGNSKQDGSEHWIDGKQYPMEMHIVHLNAKYRDISVAKEDPNGLAVLGALFRVADADNTNYNTIVAGLSNVSLQGTSSSHNPSLSKPKDDINRLHVLIITTQRRYKHLGVINKDSLLTWHQPFRLDSLLPRADTLSKYYRYQGSLTTPDCSEAVIWTVLEEPIDISRPQLNAFADTVHFTGTGEKRQKMTDNFRPPQPLNKRKVSASKDATANSGFTPSSSLLTLLLAFLIGQNMIDIDRLLL